MRTPPNPKQGTSVATIQGYMTAAEDNGGGYYSITPANFTALLDWLAPRAELGTTVRATAELVGGPVRPPVQP
jgi:hypothetical protein